MKSEFFKGDVKDVCAELEKELERCGKIKVGEWLILRKLKLAEAEQFGMNVEDFRKKFKKN